MPRQARIVIAGVPHHITQRGNNRQAIFHAESDYREYLQFLKTYAQQHGLSVLGYCLMTNHVHLVSVPQEASSLSLAIGRTHTRYTQRYNARMGMIGHLWQDRFYSSPLDEVALWMALRYVELNPVRAGLVREPWEYPWSSAFAHIGGPDLSGLLDLDYWKSNWDMAAWREHLSLSIPDYELRTIRQCTHACQPINGKVILQRLNNAREDSHL